MNVGLNENTGKQWKADKKYGAADVDVDVVVVVVVVVGDLHPTK